jgi:hypothetical protein
MAYINKESVVPQQESYCKLLLGLVAAIEHNNITLADVCYQSLITNYLNTLLRVTSPRIIAAREDSDYDAQSNSIRRVSSYTSKFRSTQNSRPSSFLGNTPPTLDRSSSSHNLSSLSSGNSSPANTTPSSNTPSPREHSIVEIKSLAKLTLLALRLYLEKKRACSTTSPDEQYAISKTIGLLLSCFPRTKLSNFTLSQKRKSYTTQLDEYLSLFHKELFSLLSDLWLFCIKPWECDYSSLTIDAILSTYNLLITFYGEDINNTVQNQLRENFDRFNNTGVDEDNENKHYPGKKFLMPDDNINTALAHFLLCSYKTCDQKISAAEEEKHILESRIQDLTELLEAYQETYQKNANSRRLKETDKSNIDSSQSIEKSNKVAPSSARDKLIEKIMGREGCQKEYSAEKNQIKFLEEIISLKERIANAEHKIDLLSKKQELWSKKKNIQKEDEEIFKMTRACEMEKKSDGSVSVDVIEDTFATMQGLLRIDVYKYLGASSETTTLVLYYSRLSLHEFTTKAFENFSTAFLTERVSSHELSPSSNNKTEVSLNSVPFLAALLVLFHSIYSMAPRIFSTAITALSSYQNDLESLSSYEINLWLFLVRAGIRELRRSADDAELPKMESLLTDKANSFQEDNNQNETSLLNTICIVNRDKTCSSEKSPDYVDNIFSELKRHYDEEWRTIETVDMSTSSSAAKLTSYSEQRLFVLLSAFKLLCQSEEDTHDSSAQIMQQFNIILTFRNVKSLHHSLYQSLCKITNLFLPTAEIQVPSNSSRKTDNLNLSADDITSSLPDENAKQPNSERGTSSTTSRNPHLRIVPRAVSQTPVDPHGPTSSKSLP